MRYLRELLGSGDLSCKSIALCSNSFSIPGYAHYGNGKVQVNILAMGDVGSTLALGMKLTGNDIVSKIGICDVNEAVAERFDHELGQISLPDDLNGLPESERVTMEDLFECDVFIFCASSGVPPVTERDIDMRMVQLEKNTALVRYYAQKALSSGFEGEFFIVSDPVDPLCKAALSAGLKPAQIQGFGLGVMNARAAFYARRNAEFAEFLKEGRVFGPHGEDLVVANSLRSYDDDLSRRLTKLTVCANMRIREMGFKPYIAPALASGALSVLTNLRGNWQYSSAWFGDGTEGAFLGMRNRRTPKGLEIEDLGMDDLLFERIRVAYERLCSI